MNGAKTPMRDAAGTPNVTVTAVAATGGSETHELPGLVPIDDADALVDYAAAVDKLLRTGKAAVSCVAVGDDVEPVAIVAGGWPLDGVCCGMPAPDCDDILIGGVGRQLWECRECGSTVWPDSWAVMPLARNQDGGWDLPEPAHLSWVCNVAVANMLFARDNIAAAQAQQVLQDLQSGNELDVDVHPAAWLPHRQPSAEVGSVWVLFGARVGDSPAGQVFTGFIGQDRNRFDHDRRRWMHGWRDGAWGKLTAAQAARLLDGSDELARRAAAGELTVEHLTHAWSVGAAGEMPAWVCDSAAVENLAEAGRALQTECRQPPSRGLGL